MGDNGTLKETVQTLEEQVEELGLITIREAAELRGCSRSAILQLLQRDRLKSENILGKCYLYREEVTDFQRRRPGPAQNTVYRRRHASDNEQSESVEPVTSDEMIQTPIN
jgi:excisionase family DNA binding protein